MKVLFEVHNKENGDVVCTYPNKIGYYILGWVFIASTLYSGYRVVRGIVKLK